MIKCIFVFLILSSSSYGQNVVVFDNTPDNISLFKKNCGLCFTSFVKHNAHYLGAMNLEGVSPALYASMNSEERNSIVEFIGNYGVTPLMDTVPESDTYGELLIATGADGLITYVYDTPDTVLTVLDDIDRIIFEYDDGKGPIWPRIQKLQYWKKYNGNYEMVLNVDAAGVLSFDGFSMIFKLHDRFNNELTSSDPTSMWSVMRDSAMVEMEDSKNLNYSIRTRDFQHYLFPSYLIRMGYFDSSKGPGNFEKLRKENGIVYQRYTTEEFMSRYPFSFHVEGGSYIDTVYREAVHSLFDEVHYTIYEPTTPLMDEDPNSVNFGELLIVVTEDGLEEYVYDIPELVYFWLDYSDIQIFVGESFYVTESGTATEVDDIYFITTVDSVLTIISCIPMSAGLAPFFKDYEPTKLSDFGFYQNIQSKIENEEYRFDLSKKKDRKKLEMFAN